MPPVVIQSNNFEIIQITSYKLLIYKYMHFMSRFLILLLISDSFLVQLHMPAYGIDSNVDKLLAKFLPIGQFENFNV